MVILIIPNLKYNLLNRWLRFKTKYDALLNLLSL